MRWRFTIINNRTSATTVIDEAVGWDKNKVKIARDLDWHGVFFSGQGDSATGPVFEFYGDAEKVLKAEYDAYGIQGDMDLLIEEDCGDGYELFKQPKFDFGDYFHNSGDNCFVSITLDQSGDTIDIRNRFDQKVNLETDKAFDETTTLAAYDRLAFPVVLPSKGIFIQDDFENDAVFTTEVQGVPENNNPGSDPSSFNSEYGMIEIGFDNNVSTEIGNAGSLIQSLYSCVLTAAGSFGCASFDRFVMSGTSASEICPLQISPWVNYQEGSPNYGDIENPIQLDLLINGSVEVLAGTVNQVFFVLAVLPKDKIGNQDSDYIYYQQTTIYAASGPGLPPPSVISLDVAYTNNNFVLNKGDRIYCFYALYHRRQNSSIATGTPAWKMTFDAGNYFRFTNISHTPASISKLFAVNEVISRVAEVITNDNVRGYSEYYGRTDSQPYSHADDGCGSLKAITNGLRIRRQEDKIAGQPSPFSVSLKDVFEGLNPIDNIGMGIEPDPNRAGYNRLRVEPWKYFYNEDVVLYCRNIKTIKRRINPKEIYSNFKFGYQKWEAEEYNGLDEFLTKREYRTTLKQVNNTLTKLSTWISSGYASEITRRIGNNNSKDWRYDKETFVYCLERGGDPITLVTAFGVTNTATIIQEELTFIIGHDYQITGTVSNNITGTITAITPIGGNAYILFFSVSTVSEFGVSATFEDVTAGLLSIELGNVINDANIIDPATIYNYRISPIRNAMRWMNKVLESYRVFDANAKIIFTDGDGNSFAEGEMESAFCKLEGGVIAENVTINAIIYADSDDAKPFLLPERVTYEYPMNSCDYKALEANPGGLIYFENECEMGYGHIDDIVYTPNEQMANFNLIPRITDLPIPAPEPYNSITTEDGIDITTEDGQILITE
jgi:hypothetical protein